MLAIRFCKSSMRKHRRGKRSPHNHEAPATIEGGYVQITSENLDLPRHAAPAAGRGPGHGQVAVPALHGAPRAAVHPHDGLRHDVRGPHVLGRRAPAVAVEDGGGRQMADGAAPKDGVGSGEAAIVVAGV